MAEYTYNAVQLVQPDRAIIFNDSIPCTKGYVIHRNESGVFVLRGIVNNACAGFARYRITFNANIAVPTGSTPTPIALGLAINGEPVPATRAIVTSALEDRFFNVAITKVVTVPRGCCVPISIQNVTEGVGGAAPIPINAQNANIEIDRIA